VICAGDTVQLGAQTNGLQFSWTPASTLDDPARLNPVATPVNNTTYQLIARIGHCTATDQVTVSLAPYPIALAGPDTTVCFRTPARLHASIAGSSFTWTPTASLDNPNRLDPIATPVSTTSYILTVRDNIGCPKPKMDTVTVNVLPRVIAKAVADTLVVVGQPLQLNAEGGVDYFWTPPIGLNRTDIPNPVANYDGSFDSIRYKVLVLNESGCADSAYVLVRIFKTNPQIFVPTAFTPNGDGLNDVFKPIAVGISKIDYFRVYNRWGQLVFSTTINGQGWDGKVGGKEQGTGTFVWLVRGTDFTGKVVFAKGTVTLIR
jgi:gliding motility-associated-like protein